MFAPISTISSFFYVRLVMEAEVQVEVENVEAEVEKVEVAERSTNFPPLFFFHFFLQWL